MSDDEYYEDRPVAHTAQGDFYDDVPCVYASAVEPGRGSGSRKRPSSLGADPDFAAATYPYGVLAVVCSYTCGFVAQPPGTKGYSHPFRLVAPVVPLSSLLGGGGMKRTEVRKLASSRFLSGLLYVPKPPGFTPKEDPAADDEFGPNQYAVLLYRMTAIEQAVLDKRPQVARMTERAQRQLIAGLINVVGPSLYNPGDIDPPPDMSDSWR